MNYYWEGNIGQAIFISFFPESLWDQVVIENYGTISLNAPNISQAKLIVSDNRLPHITNHGTMTVQVRGEAIIVEGWSHTQHITNTATGIMRATATEHAFGLYLENGGLVENAGQIIATVTGGANVSRGAYGMVFHGGVATVHNSGLIQAADADAATDYASAIHVAWSNSVTILNEGVLRGDYAIFAEGAQISVENSNLLDGKVYLGDGNSRLTNSGNIVGTVDLGDGDDLYDGRLGAASGAVFGGLGYDRLYGGNGAEHLLGEGGQDRIWGGGGADDLDGGLDADIFVYTSALDSTTAARDRIRAFQSGIDTIELRYLSVNSISWASQSDGTGTFNLVTVATAGGSTTIRVDGALAVADFAVVEDRQVNGTSASDTLTGGAGNDLLDGLGGADQMAGGAGDDTYRVDNSGDVIVEAAGTYYDTAIDTVLASATYTLTAGAHIEFMSAIDQAASTALALTGNGFAQTITGNAGANSLAGGGGADTLSGLGGDDIYYLDSADTIVREAIGGGSDRVVARVAMAYLLAAGAEIELLTIANDPGLGYVSIGGNEFSQALVGNADANGLGGGGGNDRLVGGGGADWMNGGDGIDVYVYSSISDSMAGAEDVIYLDYGEDLIDLTAVQATSVSWAPSTRPIIDGGAGLPIYGYMATVVTPGGNMALKILGRPFRTDFLLGGEILGTGNAEMLEGATASDVMVGREGNDVLFGRAGDDFLAGGSGDDVLDGGTGADQMIGGLGDDVFHVDDNNDLAWEDGYLTGTDTVIASASYTLTAGSLIEILRTANEADVAPINLAGNMSAQTITGNTGSNILDGGMDPNLDDFNYEGIDTLRGLGGDDTYYVGRSDVVFELAGQGHDIVYARESYVLNAGASVEVLATASQQPISLTGNEYDQTIVGNAGANTLRGAGGADRLLGGGGNDILHSGRGNDWLKGGEGTDIFRFETPGDSRTSAMRSDGKKYLPDQIADFAPGLDKIDLSAIDANAGTGANDAFVFIGSGAFTNQAGQLRVVTGASGTSIFADIDGDGFANMHIVLLTPVTLTASDFIL